MIVNTAYSSMYKPVVRPTYGGHVMNMHYGTYADAAPILTISRVLMTRTGLQTVNVRVEWNVVSASYVSRYYCELRDSADNVLDSVRTNDRYCDFTCTIGEAFYVSVTTNNPYYYGYAKTDVITPYVNESNIVMQNSGAEYMIDTNIPFNLPIEFNVYNAYGDFITYCSATYDTNTHMAIGNQYLRYDSALIQDEHYFITVSNIRGLYQSKVTEFYVDSYRNVHEVSRYAREYWPLPRP